MRTGAEVLYLAIAGTLYIANTGIRNRIPAIIGAPIVSIIPKILGLTIATTQVVITMKPREIFSAFLAGVFSDLTRPTRPS